MIDLTLERRTTTYIYFCLDSFCLLNNQSKSFLPFGSPCSSSNIFSLCACVTFKDIWPPPSFFSSSTLLGSILFSFFPTFCFLLDTRGQHESNEYDRDISTIVAPIWFRLINRTKDRNINFVWLKSRHFAVRGDQSFPLYTYTYIYIYIYETSLFSPAPLCICICAWL